MKVLPLPYVVFEREAREFLIISHFHVSPRLKNTARKSLESQHSNTNSIMTKTLTPTLEHRYDGFTGGTPVGNGEWQVFMNKKWTTLLEITTTALNDARFQALMKEKERLKSNRNNMIDGVRLAGLTGKAGQESLNGVYLLNEKLVITIIRPLCFRMKRT